MDSHLTGPASKGIEVRQNRRFGHISNLWSRPKSILAAMMIVVFAAGCKVPSFGGYPGATTQARTEHHLYQGFIIAGFVVGGITAVLILWAVFRYRRKTDQIPRQTQYHTVIEIIYTVVPIIIVLVLFAFTVFAENIVDATPPHPATSISVYAFQWGWAFDYPGGVRVIGETTQDPTMVVPTGEQVAITLRSLDVVHGFYVPAFNFSRYAQPGVVNHFDFNVLKPGIFRGQCTQLCGIYHSLMIFQVKAVSPVQYQQWLAKQQAAVLAKNSTHSKSSSRTISLGHGGSY